MRRQPSRRFAALLDAYGIAWADEPRTFVVRSLAGIRRTITPDFYLRDHDVFVHITTLRHRLIARHRAIRALREQHPDVRIVVLGPRDVAAFEACHADEPIGASR